MNERLRDAPQGLFFLAGQLSLLRIDLDGWTRPFLVLALAVAGLEMPWPWPLAPVVPARFGSHPPAAERIARVLGELDT